jgi:hypothetical protein
MNETIAFAQQNQLRQHLNHLLIEYSLTAEEWKELHAVADKILEQAMKRKSKMF